MDRSNKSDFTVEIEEIIGVLKENDKNDWCKAVAKISWNGNPTTIDIRNFNMAQKRALKGISLSDEETDRLVDLLLENDYGSLEALTKAIEKKKSRFTISSEANSAFDEDEPLHIDIDL